VSVTFVHCVETAKDTAIVAVECETLSKLSIGTVLLRLSVVLEQAHASP